MNEYITRNEVLNDGKTIHLYFNSMIGLYVAYGISAYLLCKNTKANESYSEEMQMPVAVINSEHFQELSQKIRLSKNVNNYRCLVVEEKVNEEKYSKWAGQLRVGRD